MSGALDAVIDDAGPNVGDFRPLARRGNRCISSGDLTRALQTLVVPRALPAPPAMTARRIGVQITRICIIAG